MAHNGSNGVSRAGPHQHSRAWQSFAPRRQSRGLSPRVGFQHGMSLEQLHIERRLSQKSEKTGRQFRPKLRSSFSAVKDAEARGTTLSRITRSASPARGTTLSGINRTRSASPASTPWNRDDKMKQGLARAIRVETLRYACFVVVMVVISM